MESVGVSLILGENITLKGIVNAQNHLVHIHSGKLTMKEGSKITGFVTSDFNYSAVSNYPSGIFIMEGGEITGNTNTGNANMISAGISLDDYSTFTMSGGKVKGNIGGDILFYDRGSIILSDEAEIGVINMRAVPYGNPSFVIDATWNGNVDHINLLAETALFDIDNEFLSRWEDKDIIRSVNGYVLSTSDISKFPLGNFSTHWVSSTRLIYDTHKLELDTTNNVIKLVVK
jgi:hypothetical protein